MEIQYKSKHYNKVWLLWKKTIKKWGATQDFCTLLWRGLPVEVVHGVTGVAGNLVETLPSAHRLLDGVLIIQNLVIWRGGNGGYWPHRDLTEATLPRRAQNWPVTFHGDIDPRGQEQAAEAIVENLVALQCCGGVVSDFNTWKWEIFHELKRRDKQTMMMMMMMSAPIKLTCCEAIENAVLA